MDSAGLAGIRDALVRRIGGSSPSPPPGAREGGVEVVRQEGREGGGVRNLTEVNEIFSDWLFVGQGSQVMSGSAERTNPRRQRSSSNRYESREAFFQWLVDRNPLNLLGRSSPEVDDDWFVMPSKEELILSENVPYESEDAHVAWSSLTQREADELRERALEVPEEKPRGDFFGDFLSPPPLSSSAIGRRPEERLHLRSLGSTGERGIFEGDRDSVHVSNRSCSGVGEEEGDDTPSRIIKRLNPDLNLPHLREVVYKYGVISRFREECWLGWLRRSMRRPLGGSPGRGWRMTNESCTLSFPTCSALASVEDNLEPVVSRAIDTDLRRTMPRHLNEAHIARMRCVLRSYAVRNPRVGYCQSMNFIAAVLLLVGFSDEGAFDCLSCIVEGLCESYHSPGLEGFQRDAAVMEVLLQRQMPRLYQLIKEKDMPLLWLTVDPLMCLYSKTLPIRAVTRLWDVLFLEGRKAIFAIFLGFISLNQRLFFEELQGSVDDSETSFLQKFTDRQVACSTTQVENVLEIAKGYFETGIITDGLLENLGELCARKFREKKEEKEEGNPGTLQGNGIH